MSWKTTKIPEKLDKEIENVLSKSTYPNKAQFVSGAIRNEIARIRELNKAKT